MKELSTKHITLIRTPIVCAVNTYSAPPTAPITLAYLSSSLINAGFDVTPIDAIGEDIDNIQILKNPECRVRGLSTEDIINRIPNKTNLIGISCMFTQEWLIVRNIIESIKKTYPLIPIVLGGEHATAMPYEILATCKSVDVCALGEGEETIIDIAHNYPSDVKNITGIIYRAPDGSIHKNAPRKRIKEIEAIPRPSWHLLPLEPYLQRGFGQGVNAGRSIPIMATRGCPYQCTFCSNKIMWTQKYYKRSPEDVINEIEGYVKDYKIDSVEFFDLTAIIHKEWIVTFATLLKEKNINITWSFPSGTRSEALDAEVTKLLADSNCIYIAYAAESGSERVLKDIKKEIKLDVMLQSMKAAKKNGLNLRCNLVVGFPKETRIDIYKTLWFQIKCAWVGVDDAPLFLFSPYPGSALFDYLVKNKTIDITNDSYCESLLCQRDITKTSHFCENIGPRELSFYSIIGMSIFYTLSYIFYPKRIIRTFHNIYIRKRTDTVFEQKLVELADTIKQVKRKAKTLD